MTSPSPPPPVDFETTLSTILGLIFSGILLAAGLWVRAVQTHEGATMTETQGRVVDSVSRRDRSGDASASLTYAPVIEFQVRDRPLRFTGNYESYRASQGQVVVVRYHADQPAATAKVVEPLEGLTAWSLLGLGGLGLVWSLGDLLPLQAWFRRDRS